MTGILDHQALQETLHLQRDIYAQLSTASKTLTSFNDESARLHTALLPEFTQHTKRLGLLKKDLDLVTQRITTLKATLRREFPASFSHCPSSSGDDEEDEQYEDEEFSCEGEEEREGEEEEKGEEEKEGEEEKDDEEEKEGEEEKDDDEEKVDDEEDVVDTEVVIEGDQDIQV